MNLEVSPRVRLDSWKAIAAHIGRSVRTVQRWEIEEGLPVHRLQLQQRGAVFAYRDELETWWRARSQHLGAQPAEGEEAEPAKPVAPRRSIRPWWVVALAATGVAVILVTRTAATRRDRDHQIAIPLTTFERNEGHPTFSPDGSEFAFASNYTPGNSDIYVKAVRGEAMRRLTTHPAYDYHPRWSPNGKHIAFWRRQHLKEGSELVLISPEGGPERSLGEFHGPVSSNLRVPGPYHGWTPDSRSLVLGVADGEGRPFRLMRLSIADGKLNPLFEVPAGRLGDAGPSVSPDGARLAFHRFIGQGTSQIYVAPLLAGGVPKAITFDRKFNAEPVWINNREIVFYGYRFGEMQLFRMNVDEPGNVSLVPGGAGGLNPAYSAAARQLAFTAAHPNSDLWRAPLASPGTAAGPGREYFTSSRQEAVPEYSPDGRSLAFTSARAGYPNVWICEANSADQCRQITHYESSLTGPSSWSPDGRKLVLGSNHAGNYDIYTVEAVGGAEPKILVSGPADDSFPFWSRDGRWIYFASNRTGRFEVWKIAPQGGTAVQVTSDGGYIARESYDGKWLYYSKNGSSVTSLWRRALTGEPKDAQLIEKFAMWYTVGRSGVYFILPGSKQIGYRDDIGGAARVALDLQEYLFMGVAVSPDERELCTTLVKPGGRDIMMFENFR